MIKDGSGSEGSGDEPTQVDLGDDLIETTAIIPGHVLSPNSQSESPGEAVAGAGQLPPGSPGLPAGVEDHLQSARILLNEGFPEEAKKFLRQILIRHPEHLEARKLLEQIHESELKQMFGPGEQILRKSIVSPYDESILNISSADSEEIIRLLEHDMRPEFKHAGQELSFLHEFKEPRAVERLVGNLEKKIGDSPRDRMDLAIGFIEMGLYRVAIRLLQQLLISTTESDRLTAIALVAYANVLSEEYYEAISVLQPILNDNELPKASKTEIFYLMGRALQALSSHAEAIGWFLQADENEPGYRDCAERVHRSRLAMRSGLKK